jgi:hypothetical protein
MDTRSTLWTTTRAVVIREGEVRGMRLLMDQETGKWEARRPVAVVTVLIMTLALMTTLGGRAQADSPDTTLPWSEEMNHAEYWETWGANTQDEDDWTCIKDDAGSDLDAFVVPGPPSGEVWRLAVVKAGSTFVDLYWDPSPGDELEHSAQGGWSWVILCSRPVGDTTSSSSIADSSSSSGTTPTTGATSTTVATSTSATVEGTVVTTAPAAEGEELPFTGAEDQVLIGLVVVLLGLGTALLVISRRVGETDES